MTTNAKELLMISFVLIATGELHLARREWRRLGQRESFQITGRWARPRARPSVGFEGSGVRFLGKTDMNGSYRRADGKARDLSIRRIRNAAC